MPKPSHGLSEEELALLTDEERAGLEDDSVIDEGVEDVEDDDTADDPNAGDQNKAPPAEAAAAAEPEQPKAEIKEPEKKPAAAEPAAEAAETVKPEAGTEPAAAPSPRLLPQYQVPADAKDRISQIDAQLDELAKKFDDGELTAQEHREAMKPLAAQRQDLHDQMLKQSLSVDSQVATWSNVTVPAFLAKHTQYEPGSVMWDALNNEVKKLQLEHDNPFDPSYLEQAHRTIQASVRKSLGLPAEETPEAKPAGEGKDKAQKRDIPPTLATAPAADITDTSDGGEFAYLDRLAEKDPIKYEEALGKLSPEKMDAYLATS